MLDFTNRTVMVTGGGRNIGREICLAFARQGAVIAMSKALAIEIGDRNVTVNCISPGAINRDGQKMTGMTFLGEDGRGGDPAEIANMTLYLASDEGGYITGQNFVVDGGRTLGPSARVKKK